jgi:hypothetical protein
VLRVPGAFLEARVAAGSVVRHLVDELTLLAHWLELETIEIGDRGDLTPALKEAISPRGPSRT